MKKLIRQELNLRTTDSSSVLIRICWPESRLTPREVEIAQLLVAGNNTLAIKEKLCVSPNTVKAHLRNIFRKTGTSGQRNFILKTWQKSAALPNHIKLLTSVGR